VGPRPQLPAGASALGALAPTTPIDTTVVLKPRDPAALEAYATAASTPGSGLYRHYLSVSEFRQRFAPPDSQISAVKSSLRAHGLAPGDVSANGLAIPVHSDAGLLGRAFALSLRRFKLHGGRTAFAPDQAPLLDASIAGLVQNVLGLDNVALAHPLAVRAARAQAQAVPHVVTGGPQPCGAARASGFYTADDLASAYQFSSLYGTGDEGAGETVAVFEVEGNFPSDITADESCYGIGAPVSYARVDGGPPAPNAGAGDGLETALDVESVVNLAPRASVIVYQGPNTLSGLYDTYNAIVSQNAARVITTSWGNCEAQTGFSAAQAESTLFQEAAAQGQSTFSATGDTGSTDCTDANGNVIPGSGLAVEDPASQPFVTGVGGTRLSGLGPPPTETVWNDTCHGTPCAGGGGISSFWSMPAYQAAAPAGLHVINPSSSGAPCSAAAGYCREVPDVASDADPQTGIAFFYNGSWGGVGGTSAGGPLFAALTALINGSGACGGSPIGFANPALYGSAGHIYPSAFNDVTSGSDNIFGQPFYSAGPGYDMASGLGSPQGGQLAANLCTPQVTVGNPGTQTSVVGGGVSLPLSASDSAGGPVTYSAGGLPPGLTINSSNGMISGAPRTTGSYTVSASATDSRNRSGSSTFTWLVVPAISSPGNLKARVGKAIRRQIAASDNNSGPLQYSASGLPRGLSIKSSTGLISGKPSSAGRYTVTVTVKAGTAASVRFTWTITGPTASRASLTGIAKGKPKLAFALNAGPGSPPVRKLQLTLPGGLSFRGGLFDMVSLAAGTTVVASNHKRLNGYTLTVSKGRLTITFSKAVRGVRIMVAAPAIRATSRLRGLVRHKKVQRLGVTLRPTDTKRFTAFVSLSLKPS
jgi:subtilase family serine protease